MKDGRVDVTEPELLVDTSCLITLCLVGQSGPVMEVGPEAEQHREALQLLSINLERRWEAIVMQALQWQNRLKRELGDQQVRGVCTLHPVLRLPCVLAYSNKAA